MIFIEDNFDPWRTWAIDAHMEFPGIITTNFMLAQQIILGYHQFLEWVESGRWSEFLEHKRIFVIVDTEHQLEKIKDYKKVTTISENLDSDINWFRPCRLVFGFKNSPFRKTYKIVSVFNTDSQTFSYKDLITAYHTVEAFSEKVQMNLFSAQPLKFGMETYNNIQFWGLQRNNILFKTIADSDFLIYPDSRAKVPTVALEARMIGTVCFFKKSDWTKTIKNIFQYETDEELVKLIANYYKATFTEKVSLEQFEVPELAKLHTSILDLAEKVSK
jgi:hypothetical protein